MIIQNRTENSLRIFAFILFMSLTTVVAAEVITQKLTFKNAVQLAQNNDPWLIGNEFTQNSLESKSVAANNLPEPRVSIGIANLAADSFEFGQEAMTHFKVGVSQMFPRGDSLAIKQRQLTLMASQYPFQRLDRKAFIKVKVGKLWLDTYKVQQTINLIEKDSILFEQLVDIVQSSYSSAVGKTRQQDLIRAQLELTRLDDRLFKLYQQKEVLKQKLNRWISVMGEPGSSYTNWSQVGELPNIRLANHLILQQDTLQSQQYLFEAFSKHPAVLSLQQNIKSSKAGIELAKQKYKTEWGINASYGYRDEDLFGNQRADLFSIGISFDLPIFTSSKQDKEVESAIYTQQAVKTKKWTLLRNMIASFNVSKARLDKISDRANLYQTKLLPQIHQQAEASLTAYTNDDGDFSEVVRARISDLNARVAALDINIEFQKTKLQLNYYLTTDSVSNVTELTYPGDMK